MGQPHRHNPHFLRICFKEVWIGFTGAFPFLCVSVSGWVKGIASYDGDTSVEQSFAVLVPVNQVVSPATVIGTQVPLACSDHNRTSLPSSECQLHHGQIDSRHGLPRPCKRGNTRTNFEKQQHQLLELSRIAFLPRPPSGDLGKTLAAHDHSKLELQALTQVDSGTYNSE